MASNNQQRHSIPPSSISSTSTTTPVTSANKIPSLSLGMTMTSPSSTAATSSSASNTSGSKTSPSSQSYFDYTEQNNSKPKLKYPENSNGNNVVSSSDPKNLFKSSLLNSSEPCSSNFNNIGENKPLIKNKMPSSSGLFSGLGVKNPMSMLGSSIGKTFTIGNITASSGGSGNTPVTSLGGLPPIPPGSIVNNASSQATSSSSNNNPKENISHHPAKPVRASLPIGAKTRLKSPSRNKPPITSMTLEDLANHSSPRGSSSKSLSGKKKLGAKRYASSLPDQERNNACSPVAFDLNSFLCNQGPIDFSALLAGHATAALSKNQNIQQCQGSSFRGHGKPTKHCKNKHLWARTSLEKDLFTPPQTSMGGGGGSSSACSEGKRRGGGGGHHHSHHSGENTSGSSRQTINSSCSRNGATSPPIANNRHSSYHPNYGGVGLVSDTAAAAAAAAAAAYNAHMFFSRPTSPLFMDSASASCCPAVGEFSNFCPSCAVKTFPRARSSAHHGLCHCCHQQSAAASNSNPNATGNGVGGSSGLLGTGVSNSNLLGGSLLGLDYEDRLLRLETDKETLHLQVSCLSDQIEAQTDKIKDLEKLLDDKKNVLETTEDQLQRELLTRSSLETQKLQLLTEISTLRLKQASLERENVELKERYQSGKSIGDLNYGDGSHHRIWEKPPLVPLNAPMRSSSPCLQDPRIRLGSSGDHSSQQQQQVIPPNRVRTPPANAYRRVDASAFGTVPRRSPHSSQLSAYNGQLSALDNGFGDSGQGSLKGSNNNGAGGGKTNSLSSGNINVISNYNNSGSSSSSDHKQFNSNTNHPMQQQFQCVPVHVPSRPFPPPKLSLAPAFYQGTDQHESNNINAFYPPGHDNNLSSKPINTTANSSNNNSNRSLHHPSPLITSTASGFRVFDRSVGMNNSVAFMSGGASVYESIASSGVVSVSPSGAFTLGSRFRSRSSSRVPPPSSTTTNISSQKLVLAQDTSTSTYAGTSHNNTRSTSTPNLAALEKQDWERKSSGNIGGVMNGNKSTKSSPNSGGHKSRGIMRIFGKLRRSNSGGLDNDQIAPAEATLAGLPSSSAPSGGGGGPFTRGGLRATAQPRLGWVKEPSPPKKPEGPITSWDSENVILWLNYIGLGVYAGDVKRWVKTGQQLLDASPQELEKELGVKNYLHRKKLILALNAFKKPEEEDHAGKLDYHWVIRWLDDVGLPQYKESFGEARVDGRVLSYLTTDDLISLKVTSVLHHASIKRGIQLLRIHKFHPDCLCRRGGPTPGGMLNNRGSDTRIGNNNGSNGSGDYGSSDGSSGGNLWGPKQVATWTNHRVMEWLKAIDLAEYAPNLRGSGVHGALIIFEARFNSELMATLLSIPANKTLLRRHLCLQINELVGKHIVQEKRTAELAQDFIPINPTTKVKVTKKTQFPPLRKKRFSTDFGAEELLCPFDLSVYPFHSDSLGQLSSLDNSLDGNTPTTNTTASAAGDKVSNII